MGGDRVRIEPDETRYPCKGTWPQFRGRTGTVVEINRDRVRPHLTEYGVAFGRVTRRTDGRGVLNWDAASLAWFKSYECRVIAERPAEPRWAIPPMDGPQKHQPGPRSAEATATASEWFARRGGADQVADDRRDNQPSLPYEGEWRAGQGAMERADVTDGLTRMTIAPTENRADQPQHGQKCIRASRTARRMSRDDQ